MHIWYITVDVIVMETLEHDFCFYVINGGAVPPRNGPG